MANNNFIINTANTLSLFASPGQDKRFPITSSQSVFSFGDFRIERGNVFDNLDFPSSAISFSNFSTLENFSANTQHEVSFGTKENELNPDLSNPNSYSYFGSFYTKVSRAINHLIDTFPYALLVNTNNSANTVYGFSGYAETHISSFKLPVSALTNQGNIIYASGITDTKTITLFKDYNLFGVQFSGTANTHTYNIIDYKYTTGTTGYLELTVNGLLFSGSTTGSTEPVYIRPTTNNYSQFQRTISNLEYQLAFDGTFKVPDNDDESVFVYQKFIWPRLIDGFNIDTYGDDFESYKESILNAATRIDETKTSWMIRTMIPEQFIELDTETQIYQKLISVYGEEFDTIKAYIDNLAFMHTANYNRLEGIPDKFMYKLSKLLAFDYHDAFSDVDMFEYLLEEDEDGKTLQDYNLELWRKMLTNIVWLYKKKGTRDALMFLFKLMGAPDCLVSLDEFVYKVNKVNYHGNTETDPLLEETSGIPQSKIDTDGYINYNASNFIFQEGGLERGNGQNYVNQWSPEFTLTKYVDNIKIATGDTEIGTRDIMNSKELQISLNPAGAIECDVFEWLQLGFGYWNWGSTGTTIVNPFNPSAPLPFSGMSVPFEWTPDPDSVYDILPPDMLTMTIAQWIDYVYASNVKPQNRKVTNAYSINNIGQNISLKKIYMTYMYWTNGQESNRLTFQKLERLLNLLERNFFKYLTDFVPATSIIETTAVVYRNTVFERQKFVYQAGINDGSEFQKKLPDEFIEIVEGFSATASVNDNIQPPLDAFSVQGNVIDNLNVTNSAFTVLTDVKAPVSPVNYGFTMNGNFYPESEHDFTTSNSYNTTTINYTSGNTVIYFSGQLTATTTHINISPSLNVFNLTTGLMGLSDTDSIDNSTQGLDNNL